MNEAKTITKVITAPGISGGLWLAGWLFTIGFVKLSLWKSLLALVAWPYFLGISVRAAS